MAKTKRYMLTADEIVELLRALQADGVITIEVDTDALREALKQIGEDKES